jgi:transcriptional regulator with AAA-type ATPase domain
MHHRRLWCWSNAAECPPKCSLNVRVTDPQAGRPLAEPAPPTIRLIASFANRHSPCKGRGRETAVGHFTSTVADRSKAPMRPPCILLGVKPFSLAAMQEAGHFKTTTQSIASAQRPAGPTVVVLQSLHPDWGRRSPMTLDRLLIGRGEECAIRIAYNEVSRRHAEFRWQAEKLFVADVGSTNGVYLNGNRVSEAEVGVGALLRFGQYLGIVAELPLLELQQGHPPVEIADAGLLIGPLLNLALDPLRRVAGSDLSIVIEGETGTGKEKVARAVHYWSGRTGPFVAINCAAIPENLVEAELFGYRRGAFTGAERASSGYFRAAQAGTLLLDEVIDLPLSAQAKLLRVLEEREITPIGETRPVPFDVRVVAAAQKSLLQAVHEGQFRGDLYARLAGLCVRLPPLRERVIEIPFLFRKLLQAHSNNVVRPCDVRLLEALCLHEWPFNVRELDLVVRRLVALNPAVESLELRHLPDMLEVSSPRNSVAKDPPRDNAPAPRSEMDLFLEGLQLHAGNMARAAIHAGISRPRAYRLIHEHPEINPDEYRHAKRRPR